MKVPYVPKLNSDVETAWKTRRRKERVFWATNKAVSVKGQDASRGKVCPVADLQVSGHRADSGENPQVAEYDRGKSQGPQRGSDAGRIGQVRMNQTGKRGCNG